MHGVCKRDREYGGGAMNKLKQSDIERLANRIYARRAKAAEDIGWGLVYVAVGMIGACLMYGWFIG